MYLADIFHWVVLCNIWKDSVQQNATWISYSLTSCALHDLRLKVVKFNACLSVKWGIEMALAIMSTEPHRTLVILNYKGIILYACMRRKNVYKNSRSYDQ